MVSVSSSISAALAAPVTLGKGPKEDEGGNPAAVGAAATTA
jgi:hypothetical protein